jgi:hypothetical protein
VIASIEPADKPDITAQEKKDHRVIQLMEEALDRLDTIRQLQLSLQLLEKQLKLNK